MSFYDGTYNNEIGRAVASFSAYSEEIESILSLSSDRSEIIDAASVILNGRATAALQTLVPIHTRKQAGIFFTSSELAKKSAEYIKPMLQDGYRLLDPACGAGNLLIACTEYLPLQPTLRETINLWSTLLEGYDLYPEMVRAARLRLVFAAIMQHPGEINHLDSTYIEGSFKGIKVGDAFSSLAMPTNTCILVNPPFGSMKTTENCRWATGKVQIAAWFVQQLLERSTEGQHIVAILPDVLRSGTRYERWRNVISSKSSSLIVKAAGRFDKETDVDVFILDSIVRSETEDATQWPDTISTSNTKSSKTVSDYFNVSVGTIVPHRDPKQGDLYPYLHARNAKKGQTIVSIAETVRTNRKVFNSPFVAIHRTSSPNDKSRCVASIVNEKREVAVENHIIVLQPKSGNLDICTQLVNILNSEHTDNFMNRRIRCRHLTASSINEIPWIEE